MPMPTLMKLLDYDRRRDVNFQMQNGCNVNATLRNVNAYCTLYVPSPEIAFNRISITGDKITIEVSGANKDTVAPYGLRYVCNALSLFGIHPGEVMSADTEVEVKDQKYSKILPIDESERKRFMIWASDRFNIYSLGRFATWRPGLLLDDVVHDVRVIKRMIDSGHSYDHRKA
jgi:hypothetical protein